MMRSLESGTGGRLAGMGGILPPLTLLRKGRHAGRDEGSSASPCGEAAGGANRLAGGPVPECVGRGRTA